ncbi:hpcH/HpaI aldolase/citrate lyase family protein [Paraburkholderia xenovorans LB400]|uniref:HpcH/HpaI aldolase n=1 Tax=Paraburkholderia xenovorans (strain LB400) TaxID=266265 RepID=Q13HI0_PARXL|nr:CoA ester lyase [Paraburkholderia xenovorans]ABE36459.1 Putative HpcH/HpaI aldolase [Paraburkholderia xenovorans LB400]AIP34799.1 hpcH/HpaI aldolase/citrate lyase family protein [Paraburkholderia xenovorans LB400]
MPKSSLFPNQSFLFVPGNRPERFEKALASGADAVIIDLEDAVPPDAKDDARNAVASWVSPDRPVLVRVNASDTPWFAQDARLGHLRGIAGMVLPKTGSADDVITLIAGSRARIPVYPMIETGKALWNALEIAKAPFVKQLLFGTLDFIADIGMSGHGEELAAFRSQLALVSRVAGLEPPIDGVSPDIGDAGQLIKETLAGKRLGFGGKMCIHPKQVSIVNQCYRPSDAELEWAHTVLEAVGNASGTVITVDGKMVDRPVVLRAERMVALARTRRHAG